MMKIPSVLLSTTILLVGLFLASCSHDYHANTLDLSFYQWNFWLDEEAEGLEPSCGWDDMHRGVGKLVRTPATVGEHFSPDYSGVSWLHVRFTLPELWAGREVFIDFAGVSGNLQVFLEGKLVGEHPLTNTSFSMDVSEHIFYTRDNHLCLRITDPRPGKGGLTGKVSMRSPLPEDSSENTSH
jgi:beta-galactosidase